MTGQEYFLEALSRAADRTMTVSDDLRRKPWKGSPDPVVGHCYVASESLHWLMGGPDGPWRPMFLRVDGSSHWFLKHKETGEILDLTRIQFGFKKIPYEDATGKGFLTKKPSKRARIFMARMCAKLGLRGVLSGQH